MTKTDFLGMLEEAILNDPELEQEIKSIRTFEEGLILTNDTGLVIRMNDNSVIHLTVREGNK